MKKILISLTLLVIFSISSLIYYHEGSMAVNKNDRSTKIFVIEKGQTLNQIANKLVKEELIRNKLEEEINSKNYILTEIKKWRKLISRHF